MSEVTTMPLQTISVNPVSTDTAPPNKGSKKEQKVKPPLLKKNSTKESISIPPAHKLAERCETSLSISSSGVDTCRICQCDVSEIDESSPLIAPCLCMGSMKFVHQACLQKWIKSSDKNSCELCKYEYKMTTKVKPFTKWERLQLSPVERRKITCSVTFHIIAITCVVWSLYVLIDRTTEEVSQGSLDWPFWTKLIVVAIGFTGGLVFMYVQCKMYVRLCQKWKAYNRVINVETLGDEERIKTIQNLPKISAKKVDDKDGGVTNVAVLDIDSEILF